MRLTYLVPKKLIRQHKRLLTEYIGGSTNLVRNTVELIQIGVQNRLDNAGIDFDAVPGLSELRVR